MLDQRNHMKLFNQFTIFQKFFTTFNYEGLNFNKTPKELEQCPQKFKNIWDIDYGDNLTY